jgi:hypothetical protein
MQGNVKWGTFFNGLEALRVHNIVCIKEGNNLGVEKLNCMVSILCCIVTRLSCHNAKRKGVDVRGNVTGST